MSVRAGDHVQAIHDARTNGVKEGWNAAIQAIKIIHHPDPHFPSHCMCTERWPCSTVRVLQKAKPE